MLSILSSRTASTPSARFRSLREQKFISLDFHPSASSRVRSAPARAHSRMTLHGDALALHDFTSREVSADPYEVAPVPDSWPDVFPRSAPDPGPDVFHRMPLAED